MADLPDIPGGTGGLLAAIGAGGTGAVFLSVKVWRWLRQEFRSEHNEKQQETFQQRTLTRAQELEKELKELQKQYNDQSVMYGIVKGELSAAKMQVESMTANKDYWKERAQSLEKENHDLDKTVDLLTAHLANAQMRLAVLKGDLDPKALVSSSLCDLTATAHDRLDAAMETAKHQQ